MHRCCCTVVSLLVFSSVALAQSPKGYYRDPALNAAAIVFAAEGDLWTVALGGGVARRLTTHHSEENRPAISPDGVTLAFSARYEGPTEVYTMPLAGGLPVRRTWEGSNAGVVGWTADGDVLYTTRNFSTLPNSQLVSIDLETNQPTLVPLAQASDGVYSDDGTLYFVRLPFNGSQTKRYKGGTIEHIWKFANGDEEAVALTANFAGASRAPMWYAGRVYFVSDRDGIMNLWSMAPDGTLLLQHTAHADFDVLSPSLSLGFIVYQNGADLWRYDIAATTTTKIDITLESDFEQMRENWVEKPMDFLTSTHISPDGDRIVMTARGQVFVAPTKQGRLIEVTRRDGVRYRDARFMPDGDSLLVMSDESDEIEFWSFPADGLGSGSQLTDDGQVLRWAGVPSPDCRYIAHHDKNQTLWIYDTQDSSNEQIDESPMGDFSDLNWSPDSRWLAYVRAESNQLGRIWLYNVENGSRISATSERTISSSPAWDPDGKWLYFLSDRHLQSDVGSPWGPWAPQPHFSKTTKLYMLALQDGLRSPFAPTDELAPAKENSKKHNGNDEGDGEKEQETPIQIDIEGLASRLHEIPVPNGDYANLFVTDNRLFWQASGDAAPGSPGSRGRSLMMLKITNDDPKPEKVAGGITNVELSADRKKILLRKGDALHVIPTSTGAPNKLEKSAVNLKGWTFAIDPREEWRQMFVDAWRLERDYFYDRNMHNVDWPAMREKYLPLADRVTTRAELGDAIAQMVAELSALHTFVRGGDQRQGDDSILPASLGARLSRDEASGGFRIDRIYQHDPDYPDRAGPLAKPGVGIGEGDIIEMINGASALSVDDCGELLRSQAGKQVRLRIKPNGADESRDVIVTPITPRAASNLRYGDWEYSRRQIVDEQGEGDLAYVHLRAMGRNDINQWTREYFPVFDRKGLIIDVRHNRGGNIDAWILGQLLRKAWFYWQGRVGDPTWNMQYAFRGHMVILCNERTASDGEAITEGFRRLGMGPAIGTRTWGGEIWLSSSNVLVDRGIATAAEFGVYGPDGIWLIEGHGVDPDIVVDNLPHATFNGQDAQLAAAIDYLKRKIAAEPVEVPPPPPHPDKSFDK